jgi:hypothetical protein
MAIFTELYIDQGSDHTFSIDLDGSNDLTGYSARGKIKKSLAPCHVDDSSLVFDFTINNGSDPELTVTLTSAVTSLMSDGRYTFDIELVSGDPTPEITRVLQGVINVAGKVI